MPRRRPQRRSNFGPRLAIFAILAFAVIGGAAYALQPKQLEVVDTTAVDTEHSGHSMAPVATGNADATVRIDMSGFTPPNITIPANKLIRLQIVNPDNAHHSDGGGIHQFAVEKLGIDVKVKPETVQIISIPPTAAGEYAFYCDTCCGGKLNPTMQGVLKVKA